MAIAVEDVEVREFALESIDPALTLVERSRGADLLVVSSRGRSNLASLLLGSVSQQCAHQAECSVLIVRAAHDASA